MSMGSVVPSTLQENTLIPGTFTITFTPSLVSSELLLLLPDFTFAMGAPLGAYTDGFCGAVAVGATVSGTAIVGGQCSATVVGGVSQFFIDLGTSAIADVPVTIVFAPATLTSPAVGPLATVTPQFMSGVTVVDTINLTVLLTAPSPTPSPTPSPVVPVVPVLPNTGTSNPTAIIPLGASILLAGTIVLMALRRRVKNVRS
jgi:LPXTG-motif cell wall-anchored protein